MLMFFKYNDWTFMHALVFCIQKITLLATVSISTVNSWNNFPNCVESIDIVVLFMTTLDKKSIFKIQKKWKIDLPRPNRVCYHKKQRIFSTEAQQSMYPVTIISITVIFHLTNMKIATYWACSNCSSSNRFRCFASLRAVRSSSTSASRLCTFCSSVLLREPKHIITLTVYINRTCH